MGVLSGYCDSLYLNKWHDPHFGFANSEKFTDVKMHKLIQMRTVTAANWYIHFTFVELDFHLTDIKIFTQT